MPLIEDSVRGHWIDAVQMWWNVAEQTHVYLIIHKFDCPACARVEQEASSD
jgi:predicted alpha/beta hydrolase family esterase